jgi:hypothetical protein
LWDFKPSFVRRILVHTRSSYRIYTQTTNDSRFGNHNIFLIRCESSKLLRTPKFLFSNSFVAFQTKFRVHPLFYSNHLTSATTIKYNSTPNTSCFQYFTHWTN